MAIVQRVVVERWPKRIIEHVIQRRSTARLTKFWNTEEVNVALEKLGGDNRKKTLNDDDDDDDADDDEDDDEDDDTDDDDEDITQVYTKIARRQIIPLYRYIHYIIKKSCIHC